jgi:DNA-binding response OmpR family regulator
MRILLVEDNRRLSDSLRLNLVDEGYAVDVAYDGQEGEELAELTPYAVIILDVMLPLRSGIEVCRSLRNHHIKTPILMLTARDALEDRVLGLDSGADDYLVKPFEMAELRARLRALLRRESDDKSGQITIADLTLDPATHFVQRDGKSIELTSREYALLEYEIQIVSSPARWQKTIYGVTMPQSRPMSWMFTFAACAARLTIHLK